MTFVRLKTLRPLFVGAHGCKFGRLHYYVPRRLQNSSSFRRKCCQGLVSLAQVLCMVG
jgi:hypothetical protein